VYRTKLVAVNASRDLALLQIKSTVPNTLAAELACAEPARGDTVYVVGNPHMLYSAIVKGIVSSTQRNYRTLGFVDDPIADEDAGLVQISGGVIGGDSGGSVYNESGKLIGVPVMASPVQETLGFAVPLADIRKFLDDNKADVSACNR
jgi:S1-C subfamily serine protease